MQHQSNKPCSSLVQAGDSRLRRLYLSGQTNDVAHSSWSIKQIVDVNRRDIRTNRIPTSRHGCRSAKNAEMIWEIASKRQELSFCGLVSVVVPSRIPNRKQKQSSLFFRILFIPNHFNRNRNRNRFVPVTIESVTIFDICEQNVTKPVLLKQLNKEQGNKFGHKFTFVKFTFVTICDRHKCRKLVTHSVWLVQTCFCFCLERLLQYWTCRKNQISYITGTIYLAQFACSNQFKYKTD